MNIHLSRAQLLMQQNRYEQAEEHLRLALAEGSEAARAHALLALCLRERDEFDEATAEAERAIHAAPDEPLGFYALAAVQWKRHRLNEAQAAIAEAIRLEPWDAGNFHILAGVEVDRYRWPEALAAAEQGLACEPDHVGCNNLRAIALVNLGRKAEAGQSIDATLSKNPEDAVTHANQGWTLLHQRQPKEAMKHFREALRLEPDLEWARQGIVEAMKARFFLYRWLLSFFLWLSRFPPNVRFALVLGIVFGRAILGNLMQLIPILQPLELPLTVIYLLFVWMTWTAPSLFNLVLRLDSFGRLVLNDHERLESTLVGICLLLCFTVGSTALFFDQSLSFIPWQAGLLYLGLMLPLIGTFRQPAGLRRPFAIYTMGVTFCVLMATYQSLNFCHVFSSIPGEHITTATQDAELKAMAKSAVQWKEYSIWGIVISTWIGAGSSLIPNRR